jgi:hypothetical protein
MDNATTTPRKLKPRPDAPGRGGGQAALPQESQRPNRFPLFVLLAVIAILATYSNHFHNSFHFDDAHTIEQNVYIRNLHNIPRFFSDATTFSSLPANQTWRPIVSLSLALDYRIANGLDPFWFHASTFLWFLVLLALTFALYRAVFDSAEPRPANRYIALFAVLWFGLHPAVAETVNYVIQRADLYATLGVVAGLVIYIRYPALRKFGVYLIPVAMGAMSKGTAVVFGGILLLYIFLFEENSDWKLTGRSIVKALPALAVSGIFAVLDIKMTAKTYLPATTPHAMYWATQPYVLLRYVRSLFLPLWLSADTDLSTFSGLSDPLALVGIVFCLALVAVGIWAMKRREHRPISFGIFWYLIASAPTSVFVLAEVENDHRMFFPFVGLILSATWGGALLVFKWLNRAPQSRTSIIRGVQVVTTLILVAYAVGSYQRNRVWRNEESLFYDVTIKSPTNGRGLMNYGLTQMEKGDTQRALDYFARAAAFTPKLSNSGNQHRNSRGRAQSSPGCRSPFPPRHRAGSGRRANPFLLRPLAQVAGKSRGMHSRGKAGDREEPCLGRSALFADANLSRAKSVVRSEGTRPGNAGISARRSNRAALFSRQREWL